MNTSQQTTEKHPNFYTSLVAALGAHGTDIDVDLMSFAYNPNNYIPTVLLDRAVEAETSTVGVNGDADDVCKSLEQALARLVIEVEARPSKAEAEAAAATTEAEAKAGAGAWAGEGAGARVGAGVRAGAWTVVHTAVTEPTVMALTTNSASSLEQTLFKLHLHFPIGTFGTWWDDSKCGIKICVAAAAKPQVEVEVVAKVGYRLMRDSDGTPLLRSEVVCTGKDAASDDETDWQGFDAASDEERDA